MHQYRLLGPISSIYCDKNGYGIDLLPKRCTFEMQCSTLTRRPPGLPGSTPAARAFPGAASRWSAPAWTVGRSGGGGSYRSLLSRHRLPAVFCHTCDGADPGHGSPSSRHSRFVRLPCAVPIHIATGMSPVTPPPRPSSGRGRRTPRVAVNGDGDRISSTPSRSRFAVAPGISRAGRSRRRAARSLPGRRVNR